METLPSTSQQWSPCDFIFSLEMEHNEHALMPSDFPLIMDTWEEVYSYQVHGDSFMRK
jgi:hypothetical protein